MSEPGAPPPLPLRKGRLPFEQRGVRPGGALKTASLWMFAILGVGLGGVAYYMAAVTGHPLTSPYVAAPAVGALWFGLRLFMSLAPKV